MDTILTNFAICIDNTDYPASLELFKTYRVLPDAIVEEGGDLRVIDESGEDYLYPTTFFIQLELPEETHLTLNQRYLQLA